MTVAATFQKDPAVLIAHPGVADAVRPQEPHLCSSARRARRRSGPGSRREHGFTDAQKRPYAFSVQQFLVERTSRSKATLTSEPFTIEKAGDQAGCVFLLRGQRLSALRPDHSGSRPKTLKDRPEMIREFRAGLGGGWKSYLKNPAPGNALIKKANPEMTEELMAFGVAKMKEYGLVTGGDAKTLGILTMTDNRWKQTFDFMVSAGSDPARASTIARPIRFAVCEGDQRSCLDPVAAHAGADPAARARRARRIAQCSGSPWRGTGRLSRPWAFLYSGVRTAPLYQQLEEETMGGLRPKHPSCRLVGHCRLRQDRCSLEMLLQKLGAIMRLPVRSSAAAPCATSTRWKNSTSTRSIPRPVFFDHQNTRVHLIDTPGLPDFLGQAMSSLQAAATPLSWSINAQTGIELIHDTHDELGRQARPSRMIVVNKIDAPDIDLAGLLARSRMPSAGNACRSTCLRTRGTRVVDCFFNPSRRVGLLLGGRRTPRHSIDQVVGGGRDLMAVYSTRATWHPRSCTPVREGAAQRPPGADLLHLRAPARA